MAENPSPPTAQPNALFWKFDISTFRLLGRELITDRITALFELVKNCYDANATKVTIEFHEVNPLSDNSKIVIRDNGIGMSFEDIRDKWMVIGTSSKRTVSHSPEPFKRKTVGKKGVGRFAVDKLGSKLLMQTKKEGATNVNCLETDWEVYEALSRNLDEGIQPIETQLFTDVQNQYWTSVSKRPEGHGTILTISKIRDVWTKDDIVRAYKELSKIVSPLERPTSDFDIFIKSQYDEFKNSKVINNAILNATEEITLGYDDTEKTQQTLRFKGNKLEVVSIPYRAFGPIKFKMYYFNQEAKSNYKKLYKGDEKIDGIKIYRDGLITTPFAEYEAENIYKRDILGIDKRRYSGFFDKVSSNDLLGFVEITDIANPEIKDATNRQDFVDNNAYRGLKKFIIEQLVALEEFLKEKREVVKEKSKSGLNNASVDLKNIGELVSVIKKEAPPKIKEQLVSLEKTVKQAQISVNKGIKTFEEVEKEKVHQENLFLSLMSLQDYAFEIAHVVRTSLARIIRTAEFFKRNYPNSDPAYQERFLKSATRIYDEMIRLDSVVDFLLSYAKSNIGFVDINVKELIENLIYNEYRPIFQKENIKVEVIFDETLIINHNQKFFEDIFENLISNSIKALQSNEGEKRIKCSGKIEGNQFIIHFSDNGQGILEEDKERIFNIYFTRTAEQGGAGIGLYAVKTRIKAMKGSIEVVENEFNPTGATFKIVLPFAAKN
jgi:signal transduction histidine kinase